MRFPVCCAAFALTLVVLACGSGDKDCSCGANAVCDESGACVCKPDFIGDPTAGCTPSRPCTELFCSGHGTCDDSSGKAVCTCDPTFAGDRCVECAPGHVPLGATCIPNPCTPDFCGAHGTCRVSPTDGSPRCDCKEGYAGTLCDSCDEGFVRVPVEPLICVVDPCQPINPCGEHGICNVSPGGIHECDCDPGYAGPRCQDVSIDHCALLPPHAFEAEVDTPVSVRAELFVESRTEGEGPLEGVRARLCYGLAPLEFPVELDALLASMTCVEAAYESEDGDREVYVASATLSAPGEYQHVFAFSGDAQAGEQAATWTVCDTAGPHKGPVIDAAAPGTLSMKPAE